MKEIKVYLRKHMVDHVVDALEALDDPPGLTLSNVHGWGHTEKPEAPARYLERVKLETVVPDRRADDVVRLITEHGTTNRAGDGILFVTNVERAIRLRTGEEDSDVVP